MKRIIETQDQLLELVKDMGYNDDDKIEFIQHFLESLEELFGEQLLRQIMAMLETRFKYGSF